jgi:hypothetical protein
MTEEESDRFHAIFLELQKRESQYNAGARARIMERIQQRKIKSRSARNGLTQQLTLL